MRISWIDNLKGIGIILIVLGHCFYPDKSIFISYIFSFHIILFFFLSGLMFHDKKHSVFYDFLKNKFQRLIIPYFFFNFMMFVFLKAKDLILQEQDFWVSFVWFIQWVLYGSFFIIPDNGHYFLIPDNINLVNIPTWFLMCLFVISIVYFVLNQYIKNRIYRIIVLFFISIAVYIESKYFYFRFPWSLEIALMAMFFYGIWHSFKEEILNFVEKIHWKYLLLVPVLIAINVYFLSTTNINFSSNFYGDSYIKLIINGIIGTLSCIIIAKNIPQNKILDFFWQNSLIILGFEGIKFLLLAIIIKLSFWYLVFEKSYLIGTLQLLSTLLVLTPIILVINRYFRFLIWDFKKK